FVVFNQRIQIIGIALRNYAINKFPTSFASLDNQIPICRRNDYEWQKPNVLTEFFISFSVSLYYFFLCFFGAYHNFFGGVFSFVKTFHNKKILAVLNVLRCNGIKVTFSEGKM